MTLPGLHRNFAVHHVFGPNSNVYSHCTCRHGHMVQSARAISQLCFFQKCAMPVNACMRSSRWPHVMAMGGVGKGDLKARKRVKVLEVRDAQWWPQTETF